MSTRSQFSNAIICPGCGYPGFAEWEQNGFPRPTGPERLLVRLSAGFRQDARCRQHSGGPAIVCKHCESQVAA